MAAKFGENRNLVAYYKSLVTYARSISDGLAAIVE
jgi:hypothetical protein